MIKIQEDFLLMLLFKELIDCLFLLLTILLLIMGMMVLVKLKKNNHRKYFLPRVDITKYNVLIDGRNFYEQPVSDEIKRYDEIRKTQQGKEMIAQQDVC